MSTSSLASFLRYGKDIANLLFCELRECLTIPIKSHSLNLKDNFPTHFFLKILQSISKLVILGILGMPCHTNLKWQYQLK